MFVMLGHAGGYFSQVASNVKQLRTSDGGRYAEPYPVMFLTAYREDRASLFDESRGALLTSLMCLFAEAIGNDDRAMYWAQFGIDDARARGNPAGVATLAWMLIPHFVRENRFVDALDVAREASTAGVAATVLRDHGADVFTMGVTTKLVVKEAGVGQELEAEQMALNFGGITVAFGLALLFLSQPSAASTRAAEVIDFCRHIDESLPESRWARFADVLASAFVKPTSLKDINALANAAGKDNLHTPYIVGYLGVSVHPEASLETAAIAQTMIVPYVERILSTKSTLYRRSVPQFILGFWQRAVDAQPFRFSSPSILRAELEAASLAPPASQVCSTLRAVCAALRVRLPENATEGRAWLGNCGNAENAGAK